MKETFNIRVNKKSHMVHAEPDTPLLYILRNELFLNGPKFGCGQSLCGACMVLLNGVARTSCTLAISAVGDAQITTLEGLQTKKGELHAVQQAFLEEQAAQCGYCLNGLVVASVSLLKRNPNPSEQEIKNGLQLNICRCGIHARAIRAVKNAANR